MKRIRSLVVLMAIWCPSAIAVGKAATTNVDIPPQHLSSALRTLAEATGMQVVYETRIAEGVTSPGAKGALTATAALEKLLAGTDLQYEFLDARTVAIRAAPRPQSAPTTRAAETAGIPAQEGGATRTPDSQVDAPAPAPGTRDVPAAPSPLSRSESEPEGGMLDEVIVTARKREESLLSVPLSVTAIPANAIREWRIQAPEDIAKFTPGFSYVASFGRQNLERPVVRGQANLTGTPNASFFVDGVYVSGPIVSTETQNLERIEVIKGPQAALYGRATFAGAINYITKRPSQEFEGRAEVSLAQHDERVASLSLSGPLIADRLAASVSAYHFRYGGEYVNAIDGQEANRQATDSGTVKLLWTPNDQFELIGTATYSRDHDKGAFPLALQGREFNNCQLRNVAVSPAVLPRSPGYFCGELLGADSLVVRQRTDILTDPGMDRKNWRGALSAKWQLSGGGEIASVTSYHDEEQAVRADLSYGGYDPFIVFGNTTVNQGIFWRDIGEEREDFSQELRFTSRADRPFRWLVGGYYFRGNDDDVRDLKALPTGALIPNGQGTVPQQNTENEAVFAAIEYDFTDALTGTLEARYAQETLRQENLFLLPPAAPPALAVFEDTFTSTTPRATLRYKWNEDHTLYANAALGNKPGGFNVLTVINAGAPISFDEEESNAFEVGWKSIWFDRRLSTTVALYYTDLTNQQLTQTVFAVNPATGLVTQNVFTDNVGKTEIKGLEIEAAAALSDRWTLRATYSYVDSVIKEFYNLEQANLYSPRPDAAFSPVSPMNPLGECATPAACATLRASDLLTYGSVAGKTTPRVPAHQASLVTRYEAPLKRGWKFSIGGDVTYESSKFDQVHNLARTGAHTYIGARIGIEGESWGVSLWGENLTDDDTSLDIIRYLDTAGIPVPAPPASAFAGPFFTQFGGIFPRAFVATLPRGRQVGVTVNVRF